MEVLTVQTTINKSLNKVSHLAKIFLFTLLAYPLSAQTPSETYVDSNYIKGKEFAYSGKYDTAITLILIAIDDNPYDAEMPMTLARVFAWNKNFKESEAQIQGILAKRPQNREALAVLGDIYLWSKNWSALENLTQQALTPQAPSEAVVKDSIVFIQKQVYGLMEQKRYKDARDALLPVKNQLPKLWHLIIKKLLSNNISLSYSFYDFQNQNTDWHTASLEYTKQLNGITFVGSYNYANRFGNDGSQYMLQAYPKLGQKMYAWLILGLSDGKAFPNGTYGISLFRGVKKYWEPELGIRIFTITKNDEKSIVLRGGLSYHKAQNRFNYLLSSVKGTGTEGLSHNFYYRRYLKDDESYMQLSLGTGANAQNLISTQFDNFIINSFAASVSGVYWFNKNWRGSAGVSWEQSQKSIGLEAARSRLIYSLGLAYRF
jgi:YaiO family outer membrane protein